MWWADVVTAVLDASAVTSSAVTSAVMTSAVMTAVVQKNTQVVHHSLIANGSREQRARRTEGCVQRGRGDCAVPGWKAAKGTLSGAGARRAAASYPPTAPGEPRAGRTAAEWNSNASARWVHTTSYLPTVPEQEQAVPH